MERSICNRCGGKNDRYPHRYCHQCHAEAMREYRKRRSALDQSEKGEEMDTQKQLLTLEAIRIGLNDRNLGVVAEATGIERGRLGKIKAGEISQNVRYWEMAALTDYLS